LLSFCEMEWCQKEGFDTLELLESLCCAGRMDKAVEVVDKVLEDQGMLFECLCRYHNFGVANECAEAG
jgi:pentatricopeptide repeat protein